MERLFAITYSDPDRAKQAMESVDWSDFERLVHVKAACWISNENGELSVHPRGHPAAGKAFVGGALGLLVGGLFAIPVVGIAVGRCRRHRAKKEDLGLDDVFLTSIKSEIETGGSAIVDPLRGRSRQPEGGERPRQIMVARSTASIFPLTFSLAFRLCSIRRSKAPASGSDEASG